MAQDERFLSLFSGFPEEGEAPEQATLLSLIEYIAERLDEIELNTRTPGVSGTIFANRERQEKQAAEKRPARHGRSTVAQAGKNTPSKGKSPVQPAGKDSTAVAHAPAPSRRTAEAPQPSKTTTRTVTSPSPSTSPRGESNAPQVAGRPSKDSRPAAGVPSVAVPASPSALRPKSSEIPAQTKSQEALASKRQEELAKSTSLSLVGALKKNLATWDGSISGDHADLEDAAGVAVAGPVWGAVQEIKEVFEKFGEDENSLLGTLKKTVADKTGISTATAWADEKKNAVRSRLVKWAGGDPAATVAGREETRDAQGRFKKKRNEVLPQKPIASDAEEAQADIAQQSLRLSVREAKNEEVRHEELISAVQGIGGDSLLDSAGDLLKLRRGNRVSIKGRGPRVSSQKPGLLRRAGQALTKGGKKLAGGAMATGGLLAGGLGLGAKEGKVASLVARPATAAAGGSILARSGRNAAALGKGTFKLGGKALLGGARVIPVAGQLLAAGLAIKDGFDGWSDIEGQRATFGLQEGQEATTGQKASMAVANALDMGGLLSGGASLLGFDLNTGDIARTLYDATTSAGTVASSLKESATAIAGDIGKGIGEMADTLSQKTSGLWTEASETVSSAVSSTVSAANGLLDNAKSTVSTTLDSIQEKAAGLWDSVKETTSEAVDTVTDQAGKAWDAAKGKTAEAVASLSDGAAGIWDSAKNFLGLGESGGKKDVPSDTGLATEASPSTALSSSKLLPTEAESRIDPQPAAATPAEVRHPALSPDKQTSVAITDKESQGEDLGIDSLIADPGDEMTGMFGKLTTAMGELKDTISSEAEKAKQDEGIGTATTGLFSGIGSVFDKIRATLAGIGTRSGVKAPTAYAFQQAREMSSQGLGALSAKYESGTLGSSAIGWDAKGGTSYGKYQISGKAGTMREFLNFVKDRNPEVYNRLSAAGPADTGGKTGRFANEWKSLVAEGKMGDLEHEFIKASHFDPAFASIKSEELRNKIKGSKALQDVLWSTAVQHRNRTGEIFNGNWKDGMSVEDFMKAVYADRATRFSTPQMRASGQRRMQEEVRNALAMLATEKGDANIAKSFANPSTETGKKLAAAASVSIMASTQDAIDRGVTYGFGNKNTQTGAVDCSGWIAEQNTALMDNINAVVGKDVFNAEARQVLKKGAAGGAAGLIKAVGEATGEELSNADLTPDRIREGMMIGMDTGEHGWDAGRYKGIDHIVQTFRDPQTGQMMVSESSKAGGVHVTPYEEWYKQWGGKAKLYGTDVTRLAQASALEGFTTAQPESPTQEASVLPATLSSPEAQPVQVSLSPERPQRESESIREIRDKQPVVQSNEDAHQLLKELKGIFAQLTITLQDMANKSAKSEEKQGNQHISMDYDDSYINNMAHDRV